MLKLKEFLVEKHKAEIDFRGENPEIYDFMHADIPLNVS
jgi:hypothetical protein